MATTPTIVVGRNNWGIKNGNLLGYYQSDDGFFVKREFAATRGGGTNGTFVGSNGFIQTAASGNLPRIDFTGGSPALLVEPAATNGIRNNSMVGASAPNTLPTNWSNAGSSLTRQSVVTGTLNGIPYVDIRISGTANNAFHDVFWDSSNIIAASVGQNWVASCYLQIIAQPNPPVSYNLAMREFNSGGTFLGVFTGPALSISTTSFNRFSFTRALNQATVAFVHPSLFLGLVNGQTYDFTIRIGYPQMELGSVATSVIPTTTSGLTRNADVINLTGATDYIGQTEGTLYAEIVAQPYNNASFPAILQVDDGADSQRFAIFIGPSGGIRVRFNANGVNTNLDSTSPSALVVGQTYKIAAAFGFNGSQALYINGVFQASGSVTAGPFTAVLNRVMLGNRAGIVSPFLIRSAAIYNKRLPDDQLQALTTL
jgi:hypothetical protein